MRAADVSVQICTYNRAAMALDCLHALRGQTWPAARFEVVLVDDGSADPRVSELDAGAYPFTVRVLRVQHGGLARARNAGVKAASGSVVLFIDDDTIPDPRLIEEHWLTHNRHARSVVLGWVNHVDEHAPGRRRPRLADFSTSFFWTANASVRREHLVAAGLFDETFTEYGWEDLELGDRLRDLGLVRRFNRRAAVSHVKRPWRGTDVPALLRQAEASGRSAVLYVRKRPTTRARLATGVSRVRMAANRLLECGEGWYAGRIARAGERRLHGFDWVAAYLWTRVAYFRSVRTALGPLGSDLESSVFSRCDPVLPDPGRVKGATIQDVTPRVVIQDVPPRVVAIHTERLGDLIVATPALRNARASWPDAHITLVCPPAVADVLRGWDAIDEVAPFDPYLDAQHWRPAARAIATPRFDLSLALTSNWSAYRLGRLLAARTRAGVVYGANLLPSVLARLFLTDPVRVWMAGPLAGPRILHRVEELLLMNAALGLRATPAPLELPLSSADREGADTRLRTAGIQMPVVLHLAGRWLCEGWTPRDLVSLADTLRRHVPFPLLLTAGPADAACGAAFDGDRRFTLLRDLPFGEWAAIFERASLVVTHDTAAVHVASAVGRPVVAVYQSHGYAVQSRQWAPWMVPNRVLRKEAPASTADHVAEAVQSLLGQCTAGSAS